MFVLNGKTFTANVLENGATGFYKVYRKNSIRLFNPAGEYIAAINSAGILCNASHVLEDGRIFYSHATVKEIGEWDSYLQNVDELHAALKACGLKKKGY
jgi:hypothetical protein